jgi:hypothetical protein
LRIDLSGRSITAAVVGSTSAPEFSLNYVEPGTANVVPLADNGPLNFPATAADSKTDVTLVLVNRGQGAGFLNALSVRGGEAGVFQVIAQPTLPAPVGPSEYLRFGVRFSPANQRSYSSALVIELADRTINILLQGSGTGPAYVYQVLRDDGSVTVPPDSALNLPDTAVGQTSILTLQFRNAGLADGQVTGIAVTGQSFQLVDAPVLPLLLKPGQSQRVRIAFAPQQPGTFNGRLRIGADAFELTGKSIGSRLIYSFTNAAATSAVSESGVVIMSPTQVGEKSSVEFSVRNTGTTAGAIASVSLGSPSTVYRLERLPVLPLNLEPEGSFTFGIVFTPNNTGALTATLRVNNAVFTLAGSGNQPLPLPAYQFEGAGGAAEPLQQPAVGITLAAAYPLPLQGTLNLIFVSDVFSNNSAVQFATGGRKVAFTIPPNSTRALFENSATSIRLQTGTVAGNIVLTPSFATEAGLDLTPASPPVLTLAIARSAPKLIEVRIASRALAGITLAVTGYSTTRALRDIAIRLSARPGKELTGTQLTASLEGFSLLWYQGAESQGFGGLFMVTVPILLQGGDAQEDLAGRIQSVEVTVRNEVGSSNAVTVAMP